MKATTVRFGADLWARLEREAERAGVSVLQHIREAALARAAFAAGARAGHRASCSPLGRKPRSPTAPRALSTPPTRSV